MEPTPCTVRRIDYASAMRFTRLFQCFRMAMAPSRLMLALLFIVSVYIIGRAMDGAFWGDDVVIDRRADGSAVHVEWDLYRAATVESFQEAVGEEYTERRARLEAWETQDPAKRGPRPAVLGGVFDEVLHIETDLFTKLVRAAIGFRWGFDQLDPSAHPVNDQTVVGALRLLTVTLPGWLWHAHPGFLALFAVLVGALWALLGGAISRQMVLSAAVDRIVPADEAVAFAARRWPTFVVAPLVPLLFILGMAVVLAIGGWVFFQLPSMSWRDRALLIGGLTVAAAAIAALVLGLSKTRERAPYALAIGIIIVVGAGLILISPVLPLVGAVLVAGALALAWVMTLLLVLWFAGVHLIYPAVSAQGADALDAMSRAFSYVMSRPWRLFFYSLVALVYGAATYLFVGLFIYLMIAIAQWATGWWVGGFNDTFLPPRFGDFPRMTGEMEGIDGIARGVILLWEYLLIAALGAYAISFYLAAYSQIYLLLRQITDGDDPGDVFEPHPPEPAPTVDKVEPAPAVPPAAVADEVVEPSH